MVQSVREDDQEDTAVLTRREQENGAVQELIVCSCTAIDDRPNERLDIPSSNTPPIDTRRNIETFPSRRRLILAPSGATRHHPRVCNTFGTSCINWYQRNRSRSFLRAVERDSSLTQCSEIALDLRMERLRVGRNYEWRNGGSRHLVPVSLTNCRCEWGAGTKR